MGFADVQRLDEFVRPEHPIANGYDELPRVFRGNVRVYDVSKFDRGLVILQFGTKRVGEDSGKSEATGADTAKAGAAAKEAPVRAAAAPTEQASVSKDKGKEEGKLVLSGFVKDPNQLDGKPAILDVATGAARVLLFGSTRCTGT